MIRCGLKTEIHCEYRKKGNCENSQDICPVDKVINLWEGGKSVDYIESVTNYSALEINTILEIVKKKKK